MSDYLHGIVFDLDGTLVDSLAVQRDALGATYKLFNAGQPHYKEFFALSGGDLSVIFHQLGLPPEAVNVYRQLSAADNYKLAAFPGVRSLLHKLQLAGIPVAICTGKDRQRTEQILRSTGLASFCTATVTGDDVRTHKPEPEPVFLALQGLGWVAGEAALLVGDSPNDIRAGKRAGIYAGGVTWGLSNERELLEAGADFVVDSIKLLESRILSSHDYAWSARQSGHLLDSL